jgi:hypothetical protein
VEKFGRLPKNQEVISQVSSANKKQEKLGTGYFAFQKPEAENRLPELATTFSVPVFWKKCLKWTGGHTQQEKTENDKRSTIIFQIF